MRPKAFIQKASDCFLCFLLALASFIFSAVILRNGIRAWPDAWSYWEGSVSLIEKHSYSYLSGDRIVYWPPLFSFFLGLFQLFLPQTGRTLALAMSVCSGLGAFAWGLYVLKIFPDQNNSRRSLAFVGSLLFIVVFVPLCCMSLSSNSLELFFVGLLFYHLACFNERQASSITYQGPILIGFILCGCMLTHNSSIVFVVAAVIAMFVAGGGSFPQRLLGSGLILLISLVPWIFIRHRLGQGGSHEFSGGAVTVIQYINQVQYGIGVFFISTSSVLIQSLVGTLILVGLLAVVLQRPRSESDARCRLCIGLSLVVLIGFFVLFNLIPIGDALGGRYIFYFPLSITPLLLCYAREKIPLLVFLILLTVGVSGARMCQRIWSGAVPTLDERVKEQSPKFIHSEYFLTSKEDAVVPSGTVRIEPPVYPWGDHWTRNMPWSETGSVVKLIDSETNTAH